MDIEKTLKFYCDVKHVDRDAAINMALNMLLFVYQSDYGEYRHGTVKEDGKKMPCWVLGETSIYGAPYYRICTENGEPNKVPADCVEFDSPAGSAE